MSDKMQFYKPKQGDTASVVADGYDRNFEALDAAKADAEATAAALAGKADKAEGKDLMTDAEREKLAGIEPGANAYTLPAATASRLGGIKAGDNVTISADGTLSASAAPYELPRASATVLGGVKVGRNLSIDSEGRLNALGGGSASGGGVLVLPYVAPETDSTTGAVTNSAAFVAAWGGILSEYLAAPDVHTLYLDADVGDGMILRMPCALLKVEESENTATYYLSAFEVFNIPATESATVSSKATVFAGLVCNNAGALQEVLMYISEGIVTPGGKPNLLGADDAVIVHIPDNATEEQLKEAVQPAVKALQVDPNRRVIIQSGIMLFPASTAISDVDFMVAAWSANPLTVSDPASTWVIKSIIYGRLQNGDIQSVTGGLSGFELSTQEYVQERISAIPQPQYRNLCLNSRGDNLNGWDDVGGRTEITLDTEKFGYPVIKTYGTPGMTGWIELGIYTDQNCPALKDEIGLGDGKGIARDIVVSYDYYPTIDCTVGLITNLSPLEISFQYSAKANRWSRVVHRIPAGSKIHAIQLGLILEVTDLSACSYFKNIQIEYGTQATPYCYDPTLPLSLTEQVVPGEFWSGFDGTLRPVYIRTFRGNISALVADKQLIRNVSEARYVGGGLGSDELFVPPYPQHISSASQWGYLVLGNALMIDLLDDNWHSSMQYNLTFKYTKA
ncbi:MAG: hypothetical protein LIO68_00105 [Rikenellaceae bacterium]|nr:hypothetical protein [Rikenellaceae bacterium]